MLPNFSSRLRHRLGCCQGLDLFFYLRIFPSNRFRKILWVTQGSNAPFTLVYLMLIFAQCRPLSTYWLGENSGDKGACMDLRILVLIQVGLNVLLDVWMLVLPLTQLYELNLKSCEKIGVIFIFSIGIFRNFESLSLVSC
ncbi:cfem domain-containing protein [Colletotrichum incanum]|uniref:Cfem domain-containing protein n=1 Tax=Colletotrichum incanum TaxID=1573173 RepID=A0A166L8M9_COLIC|nr:cfem domain-containing protein [Colletotrichum incanum]